MSIEKKNYEGVYPMKMDTKNRIALPAKLRAVFEGAADKDDYVVCYSQKPVGLSLVPRSKLGEIYTSEELRELSPFICDFNTQGKTGRFLLNSLQREFVGKGHNFVVAGRHDFMSVHAQDVWDEYRKKSLEQFKL